MLTAVSLPLLRQENSGQEIRIDTGLPQIDQAPQ